MMSELTLRAIIGVSLFIIGTFLVMARGGKLGPVLDIIGVALLGSLFF